MSDQVTRIVEALKKKPHLVLPVIKALLSEKPFAFDIGNHLLGPWHGGQRISLTGLCIATVDTTPNKNGMHRFRILADDLNKKGTKGFGESHKDAEFLADFELTRRGYVLIGDTPEPTRTNLKTAGPWSIVGSYWCRSSGDAVVGRILVSPHIFQWEVYAGWPAGTGGRGNVQDTPETPDGLERAKSIVDLFLEQAGWTLEQAGWTLS